MPDYIDLGLIAPENQEQRLDVEALAGHTIKEVKLVGQYFEFAVSHRGSKMRLFKVSTGELFDRNGNLFRQDPNAEDI